MEFRDVDHIKLIAAERSEVGFRIAKSVKFTQRFESFDKHV